MEEGEGEEAFNWEQLPPREKRSTNKKRKTSIESLDEVKIASQAPSKFVGELQQTIIQDNIDKRTSETKNKKNTTLESKDGCSGECYECNSQGLIRRCRSIHTISRR